MISLDRTRDIISFANQLKMYWKTNDPYEIAEIYGFKIRFIDSFHPGFKAHVVGIDGYPTVISINNSYTPHAKKILCAHELGHALLHSENVCNHVAESIASIHSNSEYEANLFAVALLADDSTLSKLNPSLESLDNYALKSILDYNL